MRMLRELFVNFKRFKVAGLLNVMGLSVAFAAFTVITIQLVFQNGYDRFHKNSDQIFRAELLYPMTLEYSAFGPIPIGSLMKEQCPLIDDYFIFSNGPEQVVQLRNTDGSVDKFKVRIERTTASFVDVLDLKIKEGDGKQALSEPGMMMIPRSLADKWFGHVSAIGKQIYLADGNAATVAAVYENIPANSIFKNNCYTRFEETEEWGDWGGNIFLLANRNDRGALQQAVNQVKIETLDQIFEGLQKKDQMMKEGKSYLRISPLTGIFYDNTTIYDPSDKGNRRTTGIMFAIGILIIVIAGINFVNFSMSLAPTRMKGINTQKVLGATVLSLRIKLMGEAVFYSFAAFLISVGLLQLFSLTGFAELFPVSLQPLDHLLLLCKIGGFSVLLGIVAGIYPAFYITSFEPALVLKGSFVMTPKGIRLRNTLMAIQFTISIILITCTLLMNIQYRFMQNYSLGYHTENIGYLSMSKSLNANRDALINEMTSVPGVMDYTFSDFVPGRDQSSAIGTHLDGEGIRLDIWTVYKNFLDFFGMPLVKGDNFSQSELSEVQIVMNETAVKMQPVLDRYFGRIIPNSLDSGRFVGVARDVHYLSLRKPIEPLAIISSPDKKYTFMFLKLSGNNMVNTVDQIRKVYDRLSADGIFEFRFLDESIQHSYESEKRLMEVVSLMGGIAIVLALVGVYGLIIFNAQYKRKEIGIRKVNGATEKQIMILLNRSFFRLLLLSFIIACPLAWYGISLWLEGFSYKADIHWWIFVIAGLITLVIALLTVSWQSWKAATENPVKSLKTE